MRAKVKYPEDQLVSPRNHQEYTVPMGMRLFSYFRGRMKIKVYYPFIFTANENMTRCGNLL